MWSLGAVAVAAAAGAWAIAARIDPDRLRAAARDHALATWERELLLGDVRLDLLPRPALRASNVSFANPKWAREPHLLQAEVVRADLELLPLLLGKVRIRRLSLDGVKAGLEIGKGGAVSWRLEPAGAAKKPVEADTDEVFRIAAVHVRNARIAVRDGEEAAEPWHVEEATLEALPGPSEVRLEARVKRHGQPARVSARFADLSRLGEKGAATDGAFAIEWARARLAAQGRIPLEKALAGQDLAVSFKATSVDEVFAFFGIPPRKTAKAELRFRASSDGGPIRVRDLVAVLGETRLAGDALLRREPKLAIDARLRSDRIDWLATFKAAGGEIRPPRRNEQVFHPDPVAWRAVTTLGEIDARIDLAVKSLELGNGIELANLDAKVELGGGRIEVPTFSAAMLGGSGKGSLRLDGRKKSMRFELHGEKLLLERWFHERGRKIPFEGGPMRVDAKLAFAGDTYRALAASTSGTLRILMGKGVWRSQRAGEMEETMVRALAPKDGTEVAFACAAADLRFESGRAKGEDIVAARSDVSQLATSGVVDLREEKLDLRGRLVPRSGPRIGLASFAGEVQVTGRLAKPTMRLDPAAKPLVVARVGAAIASAGATVLGSALIDAATAQENPCK